MSKTLPDTLAMIHALIASPSISSGNSQLDQSNLGVIHLLAEWLEALGFEIKIKPLSERKANLIATLGDTERKNGLVLSGHTDTVPYDEGCWSVDPFAATIKDDRLYGLGSADMKSFFVLVLEAVRHYRRKELSRPVVVLATADEESSMNGARALAREGIRLGRCAVIGEPTGLRPIRMHKGVMMESIRVTGRAGHSSNPALGASAAEGMLTVLGELLIWRSELQSRYKNPLFEVAVPTLNIGSIHGGDNPNRICARCESQIDIRPLPGMDMAELRHALKQRLEAVLSLQPRLSLETVSLMEGLPAFETPAETELVRLCEKLSGQSAGAVAFGTEAPFLSQLGMETVILGPGSIDQAHQPDEYLSLAHIEPAIRLLRKLIEHHCIASGEKV